MRAEIQPVQQPWSAQTHPCGSLVRFGADLVHLTEELHIRLLALTLTMLGAAGALTVPLAQTNAREHATVATAIFAALAIIASVSGLAHRRDVYCWLRARRAHQLAPGVVAAAMVLADGSYSPSWWTAEALLLIVAAVADARTTLLAGVSTTAAYLAGTLLRGASLFPGGNSEYLTVALSLTVMPVVARTIAEVLARFTLRLHQIELQAAEAQRAPIRVHVPATPIQSDPDAAVVAPRHDERTGKRRPWSSARGACRLTAKQLEVALLARDGLRQAEIAAALTISPRQVERHLEQARGRAGAATTAHLIAMLVTSGLGPAINTTAQGISGG